MQSNKVLKQTHVQYEGMNKLQTCDLLEDPYFCNTQTKDREKSKSRKHRKFVIQKNQPRHISQCPNQLNKQQITQEFNTKQPKYDVLTKKEEKTKPIRKFTVNQQKLEELYQKDQTQSQVQQQQKQSQYQEINNTENQDFLKINEKNNSGQFEQRYLKLKNKFLQQQFDIIEQDDDKKFIILYENIIFYSSEVVNDQPNDIQIKGKLYQTTFDQNYNPKFTIQKGTFKVNIEQKKFLLNGEGKEYLGKSNIVGFSGKFVEGRQQRSEEQKNCQTRSSSLGPRAQRKIIIKEGDVIVNNPGNFIQRRTIKFDKIWLKYNQQINQRDVDILNKHQWLTSSIIDSFVSYLNIQSEKEYFQKDQKQRQQIRRILFIATSLTTNFGTQYTPEKIKSLFEAELLQFKKIKFELTKIYKKIGFPINNKNSHWQFLLFDFDSSQIEKFDSMQWKIDDNLIQALANQLNSKHYKQIKSKYSGQQNNGYSCGYHVCSFMLHCYNLQFITQDYQYNEDQISKLLLNVIQDEGNK